MTDCLKPRDGGEHDGGGRGGSSFLSNLVASAVTAVKRQGNKKELMMTKQLAANLDLDVLGKNFMRFAGGDESMDTEEYERFTKEHNMTRKQAADLWLILDKDGSGEISKQEFADALSTFQRERAWLRYCPDCIYQNSCAYCLETNASCNACTENNFCAACWADHPARHRDMEGLDADGGGASAGAPLSTAEQLRTQFIVRPLNWAYTSPMMAWLPVAQKAQLRQALRIQQQIIADAQEKARREEEAALALRR